VWRPGPWRPRTAGAAGTGWDWQWLLLRYLDFMADKPTPQNANASLVGLVTKIAGG
jgi:hypothetical protein